MAVTEHYTPLFDPIIINKATELLDSTDPVVDLSKHNCILRPIDYNDFDKSFGELLAELNPIGDLDRTKFKQQFNRMRAAKNVYYIVVIEDKTSGKVVAAGVLILDEKFYRATTRGRIEMLIVEEKYRGRGFGVLLVRILTCIGQYLGCYRVSLETYGYNKTFYTDKCYYKEEKYIFMEKPYPNVLQKQ